MSILVKYYYGLTKANRARLTPMNPASQIKLAFKKLIMSGWFILGNISLLLGIIGAFLPLLPTTVFILFAVFCFSKSSPKMQAWLENTKVFGPMIMDWRKNGAIAVRYKIIAVTMMAVVFIFSLLSDLPIWLLLTQAGLMLMGATYVLTRPHS